MMASITKMILVLDDESQLVHYARDNKEATEEFNF